MAVEQPSRHTEDELLEGPLEEEPVRSRRVIEREITGLELALATILFHETGAGSLNGNQRKFLRI